MKPLAFLEVSDGRNGASGSGRRFTGVTSGSGNIWRKIAEGCWGASGYGGSWAAECERSAERSGDKRKCWEDVETFSWMTRREKQWLIAYVQVAGPEPVEVAYDEAVELYEQADALDSQA